MEINGNYTKSPNFIYSLIHDMSGAETKITMILVRFTYGWGKNNTRLTVAEMQAETGLSKQGVINGIKEVESRGIFTRNGRSNWVISDSFGQKSVPKSDDGDQEKVKKVDQKGQKSVPDSESERSKKLTKKVKKVDQKGQKSVPFYNIKKDKERSKKVVDLVSPEVEEVFDFWSEANPNRRTPRKNKNRIVAIKALLSDPYFAENWRVAMRKGNESAFLQKWGGYGFDWFLGQRKGELCPNWEMIFNGKYDNDKPMEIASGPSPNGHRTPKESKQIMKSGAY